MSLNLKDLETKLKELDYLKEKYGKLVDLEKTEELIKSVDENFKLLMEELEEWR